MTAIKNLAASVRARRQNQARLTAQPFQQVLQYFAMERFLYRLSQSPHRARFTLKGALMLHVWNAPQARATNDIDFLGRTNNSRENLSAVVRDLCSIAVEPDGMIFDPDAVHATRLKEDADYEGVRVRFIGNWGKARVAMQIDVGFGDVITPDAQAIVHSTLHAFPRAEVLGYSAAPRDESILSCPLSSPGNRCSREMLRSLQAWQRTDQKAGVRLDRASAATRLSNNATRRP